MSESITPREQEIRNLQPWCDYTRSDAEYLLRLLDIERAKVAAIDALHGNSTDPSECMECDHDRPTKGTEPRAYPCLTKAIANGSASNAARG